MQEVVILSGSPSAISGTEKVLEHLGTILTEKHFSVKHISVRDVPKEDLFQGDFESQSVIELGRSLQRADGVIIGSPVYKAAYSGVLKALLDILPQDILQHKPVLPLMTGGSPSHMLALEYTLKPLLATLKGQSLKGVYMLNSQIAKHSPIPITDEDVLNRMKKQLHYFIELLKRQKTFAVASPF
ncbi:NADPH-dependent FMN reductase [Virgibacillus halophilus]|uniref:NADPH-dependent FMN reductase n=1 Tax=Tigheibacillus halophilus TaxID=361280 RepID=A0ABU5C881_9BACI|nr:NADPH-dependent FMN reductase [Virgibacillus halophilus]